MLSNLLSGNNTRERLKRWKPPDRGFNGLEISNISILPSGRIRIGRVRMSTRTASVLIPLALLLLIAAATFFGAQRGLWSVLASELVRWFGQGG